MSVGVVLVVAGMVVIACISEMEGEEARKTEDGRTREAEREGNNNNWERKERGKVRRQRERIVSSTQIVSIVRLFAWYPTTRRYSLLDFESISVLHV